MSTPNKDLVIKVLRMLRKGVPVGTVQKQLGLLPGTVDRIKREFDENEFPASWIEELNAS